MITNWDFWQVIVEGISSILSGTAIILSVWIYFKIRHDSTYENFDDQYSELLKIGMENPKLRTEKLTNDYKNTFKDDDLVRYEIYAFMCWNFCETIVDRGDEKLMVTWWCVLETENSLHRQWLEQEENQGKFKPEFLDFIKNKFV